MNAKDLYNELITSNAKGGTGYLTFNFLEQSVRVTAKSTVGYVFQDWLEKWMESKEIKFHKNANSQNWPDFYLDPGEDNIKGVVEIKTFESVKNPNFDIANFDAYFRSLRNNAYRLDADYLIFAYELNNIGDFKIKDIWLKKVWEISCPSKSYPIKVQAKQKIIYNIRPANWKSKKTKYRIFDSRKQYVEAIYKTLQSYSTRKSESQNWLKEVAADYKKHSGHEL